LRALVTEMGLMRDEPRDANKKPRTHGRGRR
jgi:hypothetical protein